MPEEGYEPKSDTNLQSLERTKLEAEVDRLRAQPRIEWIKASLLVITIFLSVVGVGFQSCYSRAEFVLAKAAALQAKNEKQEAETQKMEAEIKKEEADQRRNIANAETKRLKRRTAVLGKKYAEMGSVLDGFVPTLESVIRGDREPRALTPWLERLLPLSRPTFGTDLLHLENVEVLLRSPPPLNPDWDVAAFVWVPGECTPGTSRSEAFSHMATLVKEWTFFPEGVCGQVDGVTQMLYSTLLPSGDLQNVQLISAE